MIAPRPPAELQSRFARHEWTAITTGKSGSSVWRLDGPSLLYVKHGRDVADEVERLHWLAQHDIPVPKVVDVGTDWLVTTALSGRPAHEPWPAADRNRVVDAVADLTKQLHALPVDACPFDHTLAVAVPAAFANAREGRVDLDDLDDDRAGWSAAELIAALAAAEPPEEDLVVGHGDLCLPNVLINPHTLRATGFVDVGRAGRADRYNDLAIITRSLGADGRNAQFGPDAADRFLIRYGAPRDDDRFAFYRLLDEFF